MHHCLPLLLVFLSFFSVACAEKREFVTSTFSSDEYEECVVDTVRLLAQGKETELRRRMSPSLIARSIEQLGKDKVDQMIRKQFIGFFEDFHHLSSNSHSIKTTDAKGNHGLAIFRSFISESGEERPFVLYVIEEDGRLVVGNLLINKTLRDVHALPLK